MEKNKDDINLNKNQDVEFSQELGNIGGQKTRNLVKVAEQQLAAKTGNDTTPKN